ncbi:hypothetical protein BVG80_17415 [Sphingobacteriales bacterium TSM_CSM]|nr:hypothetical protein BVG80_17415 [Sphingobacteriales bacterium TSM_CSM]
MFLKHLCIIIFLGNKCNNCNRKKIFFLFCFLAIVVPLTSKRPPNPVFTIVEILNCRVKRQIKNPDTFRYRGFYNIFI